MKKTVHKKILNNLIIIVLALLFIIGISILLNIDLFINTTKKEPITEEQLNEMYSVIINKNKQMLENPIEYGDKYCSGYVSTKNDLETHKKILNNLQELSDEICHNANNDYDKVKAIAYYVAENIYYNHVAADKCVTADTISLETVLETNTATCAGYSNLFSALCNMQGIYCVNLRGGTHLNEYISADKLINTPINHEWNAVKIDNEWIFVDITWLSNNQYTTHGYIKDTSFDDKYFDMTLEEMSYEHRIDIIDYRNFKNSINSFE